MAGLILHNARLPHEGYGHVILGAPGPILLYRISPTEIRASIDVPAELGAGKTDWTKLLTEQFCPHLPASLKPAFHGAVQTGTMQFQANRYQPRIHYGSEKLSLVGDAVGFQHPLTAMGMTLGFQDVEALVSHETFTEFERERRSRALVPELLAMALYRSFLGNDLGAREVRRAIYSMWRKHPAERERTMQLLCGDLTSPLPFSMSLLHVMQLALTGTVNWKDDRSQWNQFCRTMGTIGQILKGLVSCSSTRFYRGTLAGQATASIAQRLHRWI
jgi:2-polyprenyl-6-methoxyphenol hydroxylase-like FAD-dependent oxidoreductase